VFLQNFSSETVREVRVNIGGSDVGFEPALVPGGFAELPWFKNDAVRSAALASPAHTELRFPLRVEFAVNKGTKRARLDGELIADSSDGWTSFASSAGDRKDIE
jgi:hypothetical protein